MDQFELEVRNRFLRRAASWGYRLISLIHWFRPFPPLYHLVISILDNKEINRTFKLYFVMYEFLAFRVVIASIAKQYNIAFLDKANLFIGHFSVHTNFDNNIYICMFVFLQFNVYLLYKLYMSKRKIVIWRAMFDLLIRNIDQMAMSTSNIHQVPPNPKPVYDYTTKPKRNKTEVAINYQLSRLEGDQISRIIITLMRCSYSKNFRFQQKLIHFPSLTSKIRTQLIANWIILEFIYCLTMFFSGKSSFPVTHC